MRGQIKLQVGIIAEVGQAQVFNVDAAPPPVLLSPADYSTKLLTRLQLTPGLIKSIIWYERNKEGVKT